MAEEIDRSLRMPLARYLRQSRIMVVLSSPFIYLCFLAFCCLISRFRCIKAYALKSMKYLRSTAPTTSSSIAVNYST